MIITVDGSRLPADVGVVDALERFQLSARRMGMGIRLRHASPELQELLSLVGLREVHDVEAGAAGRGGWAARWPQDSNDLDIGLSDGTPRRNE
jgi:hypothetical protein